MIYKITLPNAPYGHLMPPEDSMLTDGKVFCVADGITRDPPTPKDFRNFSYEEALEKYPNPSGARFAADVFCKSFIKPLKNKIPSKEKIEKSFIFGNQEIAKLNKAQIKKIDYLVNDFFGCVASGGVIHNNRLYWGGIGDCGIIIFDKSGKVKFQTPNWIKPFEKYEKKNLKKPDYNFAMPGCRKVIRSKYRNNPDENASYGALTGEQNAEKFMNFGETELNKGDLVVFYTDGFEETVRQKDFFEKIYQKTESLADQHLVPYSLSLAKKDYYKFGRERTLIATII